MSYKVVYWEVNPGVKAKRITNACFAQLGYGVGIPAVIRYSAPVKGNLSAKAVKKYVAFVHDLFDNHTSNLFKSRIPRGKVSRVGWELKSKGMTKIGALVYLTAFRYVDEFAGIVKEWASGEYASLDESFVAFQVIHTDHLKKGIANNLGGHGLMYNSQPETISLETFRARLKEGKTTVHAYFAPPPKVVAPPVAVVQYAAPQRVVAPVKA